MNMLNGSRIYDSSAARSLLLDGVKESRQSSLVLVVATFSLLSVVISAYFQSRSKIGEQTQFWKRYPAPGLRQEWLAWMRLTLRSVFGSKGMVDDGYNKVGHSII
jgi:hypothetical protein